MNDRREGRLRNYDANKEAVKSEVSFKIKGFKNGCRKERRLPHTLTV